MKRTPLKRMGKNKAREIAKYWPLRRKFIQDNPFCQFPVEFVLTNTDNGATLTTSAPSCINRTASIHHMKGQHWRIMNETKWWLAVCVRCHQFIENNKNRARELGLILYS